MTLSKLESIHVVSPPVSQNAADATDELPYWAFTGTIVGSTGRSDPGYVRLSVRPVGQTVGQTVAEPPT